MLEAAPMAIVAAAGLYLMALGSTALVAPSRASHFLLGFASSPLKHYLELAIRFLVGGAFVLAAPQLRFPGVFGFIGWILVATTVGLLIFPWRWHHRFARRVVPVALRFLPAIGVVSAVLGGLLLWAVC